jgi:hypothetical protein
MDSGEVGEVGDVAAAVDAAAVAVNPAPLAVNPAPGGLDITTPIVVTIKGKLANGTNLTMETINVNNGTIDETYKIEGEMKPEVPANRLFLDFVNKGQKIDISTGATKKKGWFSGGRTKKNKKRNTKRQRINIRKSRRY